MRRIIPILIVLIAAVAPAGAAAQGNAGVGAYGENPPSAGGNGDTPGTSSSAGTSSSTGTSGTDTSSAASSTTGTSPTSSGASTTSSSTSGSSSQLTSESTATQSSSASGSSGELPMTGSNTWILVVIGAGLVSLGIMMRRRMRLSVPAHAEPSPQDYLAALKRISGWEQG